MGKREGIPIHLDFGITYWRSRRVVGIVGRLLVVSPIPWRGDFMANYVLEIEPSKKLLKLGTFMRVFFTFLKGVDQLQLNILVKAVPLNLDLRRCLLCL